MLSVLVLVVAVIAYIYLHRTAKRQEEQPPDLEVPAHAAKSIKSSDRLFVLPASDIETARPPTGVDFWNVPGPSADVSTARTATSFEFLKPDIPRQRVNNAITARSAHSMADIATARVMSYEQLTNTFTARSSSTVDCVGEETQPAKTSINGDSVVVDVEKHWRDEDLLTCVAFDDDVRTAVENLGTAKLNETDVNFEDKYRFVNFDRCRKNVGQVAVPVAADPATMAATKSMKKRIKLKNKAKKSRASMESNVSTAIGADLSVTSSAEKVIVGIVEEVVNDELRCFNVMAKI